MSDVLATTQRPRDRDRDRDRRRERDAPNDRALRAAKLPLPDDAPLEADAEWFDAFRRYTTAQYHCAVSRLRRVWRAGADRAAVLREESTLLPEEDAARLRDGGFHLVLLQARLVLDRVEHVFATEMALATQAPMREFRRRCAVLLNRVRSLTERDDTHTTDHVSAREWARSLEVQALSQDDAQACEITRQSAAVRQDTVVCRVTLCTHRRRLTEATAPDDDAEGPEQRRDHFFQEYYAQLALHLVYLRTFADLQQEEIFRALRYVPRTGDAHRRALGTLSEPGSLLRQQFLVYLRTLRYWAAFCSYYTTQLEGRRTLQSLAEDFRLSQQVAECLPGPVSVV